MVVALELVAGFRLVMADREVGDGQAARDLVELEQVELEELGAGVEGDQVVGEARVGVVVALGMVMVVVLARVEVVQEVVEAEDKVTMVPPEHQCDPQDAERSLEVGEANLANMVL